MKINDGVVVGLHTANYGVHLFYSCDRGFPLAQMCLHVLLHLKLNSLRMLYLAFSIRVLGMSWAWCVNVQTDLESCFGVCWCLNLQRQHEKIDA